MDSVDYGIRSVLKQGGSRTINIPMPVFKKMDMPKSFKWEIGTDNVARLIPIYSSALIPLVVGLVLSSILFTRVWPL